MISYYELRYFYLLNLNLKFKRGSACSDLNLRLPSLFFKIATIRINPGIPGTPQTW